MDQCSFKKKFTTLLLYSSADDFDGPPKGHQKSCAILLVFWLLVPACFGMTSWQNLCFLSEFCFPIYEILISLSVIYHKQLWHCSVLGSHCHEGIPGWHSGFDLREEKVFASGFFWFHELFLLQWILLGNKKFKTMSPILCQRRK